MSEISSPYTSEVPQLMQPQRLDGLACREAALNALQAFQGGMHVGGGITAENAGEYLDAGASHVIVTSHVFRNGRLEQDRLNSLVRLPALKRPLWDSP